MNTKELKKNLKRKSSNNSKDYEPKKISVAPIELRKLQTKIEQIQVELQQNKEELFNKTKEYESKLNFIQKSVEREEAENNNHQASLSNLKEELKKQTEQNQNICMQNNELNVQNNELNMQNKELINKITMCESIISAQALQIRSDQYNLAQLQEKKTNQQIDTLNNLCDLGPNAPETKKLQFENEKLKDKNDELNLKLESSKNSYSQEIINLKDTKANLQQKIKYLKNQFDSTNLGHIARNNDLLSTNRALELKLQKAEEENQKLRETLDQQNKVQEIPLENKKDDRTFMRQLLLETKKRTSQTNKNNETAVGLLNLFNK